MSKTLDTSKIHITKIDGGAFISYDGEGGDYVPDKVYQRMMSATDWSDSSYRSDLDKRCLLYACIQESLNLN